jgi:hypothetical protein
MTTEHQASRTLVKSPPELWAECSDAGALARHIGEFGEIRITRLEPETSVAWEGDRASGTVQIEPSGWGTRVTLTVQTMRAEPLDEVIDESPDQPPEQEAVDESPDQPPEEEADAKMEEAVAEPDLALAADPAPAVGRWKRLMGRARAWFMPSIDPLEQAPLPIIEPEPLMESDPEPVAVETEAPELEAPPVAVEGSLDADAVLAAALDSLGQAHHRPFSRA